MKSARLLSFLRVPRVPRVPAFGNPHQMGISVDSWAGHRALCPVSHVSHCRLSGHVGHPAPPHVSQASLLGNPHQMGISVDWDTCDTWDTENNQCRRRAGKRARFHRINGRGVSLYPINPDKLTGGDHGA